MSPLLEIRTRWARGGRSGFIGGWWRDGVCLCEAEPTSSVSRGTNNSLLLCPRRATSGCRLADQSIHFVWCLSSGHWRRRGTKKRVMYLFIRSSSCRAALYTFFHLTLNVVIRRGCGQQTYVFGSLDTNRLVRCRTEERYARCIRHATIIHPVHSLDVCGPGKVSFLKEKGGIDQTEQDSSWGGKGNGNMERRCTS